MKSGALTIVAAVAALSLATQARANLTLVEQAGSGVDLNDIHVGQTFTLDTVLEGSAGEHLTSQSGGFIDDSSNLLYDGVAFGPNERADLSTDPVFLIATFTAESAGLADVLTDFSQGVITTNKSSYKPLSETLSFNVLPAVSAAPEPSTWLLMFAGIGGIGLMLRRAKKTMSFRFKDAFAA